MASSLNGTDAAACSVDHGDVVVGNLQRLRSNESFNDVQFSLRDGTVRANSVILSMSSDYFATMISNEKFIEGQTKHIVMKEYGTQKAMESIVEYVYSGKMNFGKLDFKTLLEVLNISKMMLMKTDKLSGEIERYINEYVILDSFNLEDFSGKELLTVVRQSGLFSEEDIIKKCIEKFEKLE